MNKKKHEMEQSIKALRGSAKGIAAAMDDDAITSEEVYCMLSTIADRMDYLTNKLAAHQAGPGTE